MSRPAPPLPRRRTDVVGVVVVPPGDEGHFLATTELDGRTLLHHALRAAADVTETVVLLVPGGDEARRLADGLAADRLGDVLTGPVAPEDDLGGAVDRTLGTGTGTGTGTAAGTGAVAALLVHDPCCPLAPSWHLSDVLDGLREPDGTYGAGAAVHPMTDTVKQIRAEDEGGPAAGVAVAGTVDRERLRVLTSPVVVPVAHAGRVPALTDGPGLVTALRRLTDVRLVPAPPIARRVGDRAGLHLVVGLREVEEHRGRRTV